MPLEFEDRPAIGDTHSDAPTLRTVSAKILVAGGILAALFLALWVVAVPVGVWLPDVVFQSPRTLAETTTHDGHRFRVVQYWNSIDFYSTELRHTRPDGTMEIHTLDGDDFQEWMVPLTLDTTSHTATVTLAKRPAKTIPWQ